MQPINQSKISMIGENSACVTNRSSYKIVQLRSISPHTARNRTGSFSAMTSGSGWFVPPTQRSCPKWDTSMPTNQNTMKRIILSRGKQSRLCRMFGTSRVTVWSALNYVTNSELAEKIRRVALAEGGIVKCHLGAGGFHAQLPDGLCTRRRRARAARSSNLFERRSRGVRQ